jgi:hypothetical protein
MRVIREKHLANGNLRVTYEFSPDESMLCIKRGEFYKLGYPVEDVIADHILSDIQLVMWDSLEQRWIS